MFDSGISAEGDLVDMGVENDIVTKQGAWFSYGDVRLGQGREKAKLFFAENPDLAEEIKTAILTKVAPHMIEQPAE
jgi:recombination protein RecA